MVDSIGAVSEYSGYQLPEKFQKSVPSGLTGKTGSGSIIDPFDLNHDGVLSYEELQAYLEAMGLIPSPSSFTLEMDEYRSVSVDMAKEVYLMNVGNSQAMRLFSETPGTVTYTPINIIV